MILPCCEVSMLGSVVSLRLPAACAGVPISGEQDAA